jgi:hypothetical protein
MELASTSHIGTFACPPILTIINTHIYAATDQGYSTLSYDRLGIGLSSLPNPYTDVQALVELALLAELTTAARNSTLAVVPKPNKILHVGHS